MRGLFGQKLDESLPAVNSKKKCFFVFKKSVFVVVVGNAFKRPVTDDAAHSHHKVAPIISPHFYNS